MMSAVSVSGSDSEDEQPEPIRNLSALIKAQQAYHAQAAEALSSIQKDVENASTEAEA